MERLGLGHDDQLGVEVAQVVPYEQQGARLRTHDQIAGLGAFGQQVGRGSQPYGFFERLVQPPRADDEQHQHDRDRRTDPTSPAAARGGARTVPPEPQRARGEAECRHRHVDHHLP